MDLDDKTRNLVGGLIAAIVLVGGYGVYRAMNAPDIQVPISSPQEAGTPTETPADAPPPGAKLSLSIKAESSAGEGSTGNEAEAVASPDLRYFEWTITGGTLEGDPKRSIVQWTAGNSDTVLLTCKATDEAGQEATATHRVTLGRLPQISRFEAVPPVITAGNSTRIFWAATFVQTLTLEPEGTNLAEVRAPYIELKPQETTTYVLKGSTRAGATLTREFTVKVVPLPEIVALRSTPVKGSPNTFSISAEFKGGKAELKKDGTVVASGTTSPLSAQVTDIKEGASVTLVVTNEAGATASNNLTFTQEKK